MHDLFPFDFNLYVIALWNLVARILRRANSYEAKCNVAMMITNGQIKALQLNNYVCFDLQDSGRGPHTKKFLFVNYKWF